MRVKITCEERCNYSRIKPLAGALVRNGHTVRLVRPGRRDDWVCEIRFHGLADDEELQLPGRTAQELLAQDADLVLFRNDDAPRFMEGSLPAEVAARARLFLVTYRWEDWRLIAPDLRDRVGFLNPLLDPLQPHAGEQLADRRSAVVFYGAQTGVPEGVEANAGMAAAFRCLPYPRLPGGSTRADGLRLLRGVGFPLEGGLTHALLGADVSDIQVPRIGRQEYLSALDACAICFCPWGYAPLTYRLFEGLARRNLVVVQSLAGLEFADGGLTAGEHYIEVRRDLSDLADKVGAALADPARSQAVADRGHAFFRENLSYRGLDLPQGLYEEIVSGWGGLLEPTVHRGPWCRAQSAVLPYLRNLPQL